MSVQLTTTEGEHWQPISVTKPATFTPAGPVKKVPKMNEDSEIAFFTQCLKFDNTAMAGLAPQIALQAIFMIGASACAKYIGSAYHVDCDDDTAATGCEHTLRKFWYAFPGDMTAAISAMRFLASFFLVNYCGQAYGNFVSGRVILGGLVNNCREMCQNVFTSQLKPTADLKKVEYLRKVIRRKLSLLVAFMRQHCRENGEGFEPGSKLEAEGSEFTPQGDAMNWHMDPSAPAISNLVSEAEVDMYGKKGTGMRPAMVQAELNLLAGELSTEMAYPDFFMDLWMQNSEDTMNLFKSAFRIVETPIPMPYKHLFYVMVFLYVYLTPWMEAENRFSVAEGMTVNDDNNGGTTEHIGGGGFASGWVSSIINAVAFYGLMEVAGALYNPFGHDPIDHDFGSFCKKAHGEMKEIAKVAKATRDADTTDYLAPPHSEV